MPSNSFRLASELTPQHQLKEEAESVMQEFVTSVQFTAVSNIYVPWKQCHVVTSVYQVNDYSLADCKQQNVNAQSTLSFSKK
jgi:nitrate/TMAO reductase-like tetraheme cytochrome c subunit